MQSLTHGAVAWWLIAVAMSVTLGLVLLAPRHASAAQVRVACRNAAGDAAAINAAIAGSRAGDEIVIAGQCLIDQVIELRGRRAYRGESRTGTVVKQADGANLPAIFASDSYLENSPTTGTPISLRHLTIAGNKAQNGGAATNGIALRSWESVIEDVFITDMGGNGILLTNTSLDGVKLTNTQVNGQINGNFINASGGHGIYVQDSGNSVTDWQLLNNWIAGSGADAIHMENAAGWMIERNHVYGVPGNAIYANRLWGTSIADNYIEGFGSSKQAGNYGGIVAKVQGGTASTISGNRVFNHESNAKTQYRYIDVSVNYGTGVVAVTGNVVRASGESSGTGLTYNGGAHTLVVASSGNAVFGVHTDKIVGSGVTESTGI
ncbi:MAG TPA: right-handed parallel beta-helix repeat-containing protein [Limnochordia bacterium]|nr:right-handed parallel beta-helix repeat-containing protein [Limnochordia bacterium]